MYYSDLRSRIAALSTDVRLISSEGAIVKIANSLPGPCSL
jgi:hypothetical protein